MKLHWTALAALALVVSCSSLPVPGPDAGQGSHAGASEAIRRSARAHGNPWAKYRSVEVSYDGEWSTIATKVQPVITDPGFRKSSVEVYQPRLGRVRQIHTGPLGNKEVLRQRPKSEVKFNGVRSTDREVSDAAALVADAYTVFLFGSSWLAEHGKNLRLLDARLLAGERCQLVAGRIAPGLGNSPDDHFIAWIGENSGLLKRFQVTLNGMDSTRGADVDVVFSEHWKAADGSVWPARFIERIQRPISVPAHDWRMTSLRLDGRLAGPGR
jgi:hypothetical protein